jgi:hypothetical protein
MVRPDNRVPLESSLGRLITSLIYAYGMADNPITNFESRNAGVDIDDFSSYIPPHNERII